MTQRTTRLTKETAKTKKEKPVFSRALRIVLKSMSLDSTLGPLNDGKVPLDSMHNWLAGKSRPTAYNYNALRDVLSLTIESRRIFPLDVLSLSQEMKDLLPGYSQQIDSYAAQYASAVEISIKQRAAEANAEEPSKKTPDLNADVSEEEVQAAKQLILNFLGMAYNTKSTVVREEPVIVVAPSRMIEVTIWSPVNVQVYLNDMTHPLMYIDHNRGFNYQSNRVQAQGELDLIFVSAGFVKRVRFLTDGIDSVEYDLGAILTREEIVDSYNRKEAVAVLAANLPSGYTFETLAAVGTREDSEAIAEWLSQWTNRTVEDGEINYLIALACEAIGALGARYEDGQYFGLVMEIYKAYRAKSSYGYIIRTALQKLRSYQGD